MKTITTFIFIILFSLSAKAHEIAITFDDLPCQQDESANTQMRINELILSALKKYHAPAIGFVNEGKIYNTNNENEQKGKIEILKLWVDSGFDLGNHTYSHPFLRNSKLFEFEQEVIKGAKISRKLMEAKGKKYQYFRHPYLDTGTDKNTRAEFEAFLKKQNYIIAPVTIDTDDYKFNQQLLNHPQDKDKIIAKYLEHTKIKFAFYKSASRKIFGRNIKHIWLLHDNLLNSYAMEDLLKITQSLDYKFITLADALKDDAHNESDNYYEPFGTSWLYRWDYTRGKVVDWSKDPEPDDNKLIESKETQGEIYEQKPSHN